MLASDIDGYRDVVGDGAEGLLVPPRNARALAEGLERLLRDEPLREAAPSAVSRRCAATAGRSSPTRSCSSTATSSAGASSGDRRRRRHLEPELFADFHVHTLHSKDCAMEVEEVLERASEVGLDVIAVTDHNELAGGLEALALAERYGVRVIVGEEVKTPEGEVIGLFLRERVPPGLAFAETIAQIKGRAGSSTCRTPSTACMRCPAARCSRPT